MLLFLAGATVHAPALRGDFFWDDFHYVRDNPTLRSAAGLRQIWFEPRASPQYYPLLFSSFWLERQAWGSAPAGYRAVNMALNGLNAVLLWLLLRRLRVPGALLAAAVFAVHPLHVESVAWITERKDVLSGAFYLLTILAWCRFSDTRKPGPYVAAVTLFVCAVLTKTMTVSLPCTLILIAAWREPIRWPRLLKDVLPFFLIGVAIAPMTIWREWQVESDGSPFGEFSILERLLVAGRALWWYAEKILLPVNLMRIYPRWHVDVASAGQYVFPVAAVAVLLGLFVYRKRLGRGPLLAVLYFAATLFPVSGLLSFTFQRFSLVADHFAYLPSIGIIALGSAVAVNLAAHQKLSPRGGAAIAMAVLAVLGVASWRQAELYADSLVLWTDTIARNPEAPVARYEAGLLLAERGNFDDAIAQFDAAIRIAPWFAAAHTNLATALDRQGKAEAAMDHYLEAIRLQPTLADAHYNLAVLLARSGKLEEAREHLLEAVRLRPQWGLARDSLGVVALRQGRRDEAVRQFSEAASLGFAPAREHLQKATSAGETR